MANEIQESISIEMQKFYGAFRGLWDSITLIGPDQELISAGSRSNKSDHFYSWSKRSFGLKIQYSHTHLAERVFPTVAILISDRIRLDDVQTLSIEVLHTYFEQQQLNAKSIPEATTAEIQALADQLFELIGREIGEYSIIVPLWGLELPGDFSLSIYGGHIYSSPDVSANPNFTVLWKLECDLHPDRNNHYGIAFYEFIASGHREYVREIAIERAGFVIHLLCLYLSSAIDKHTMTAAPKMRFTHIDTVPVEKVYIQELGMEGLPTLFGRPRNYLPHRIGNSRALVDSLFTRGFRALNSTLESTMNQPVELSERLKRAIMWFGRSVESERVADSFLFCAISAETLLSTGRTPQDEYAHNMARLTLCYIDEATILHGFRSPLLGSLHEMNRDDRMEYLKQRIVALFEIRNHIVHGLYREEIIIGDMIEFEDVLRATIYAVSNASWMTLEELRNWVQSNPI